MIPVIRTGVHSVICSQLIVGLLIAWSMAGRDEVVEGGGGFVVWEGPVVWEGRGGGRGRRAAHSIHCPLESSIV